MGMSELGAYLRRHREERGWSLDDVEAMTRIRRRFLVALEAGDWDNLPPGVYTRGLLRNYARALGVSVNGVGRMYLKERPSEARPSEPQLISQPLTTEPRLSFELVLAGVLLVVAVGLIAWVLGTQLPTYLDASAARDAGQVAAASTATPTAGPTRPVPGPRQTAQPARAPDAASAEPAVGAEEAVAATGDAPDSASEPTGGAATAPPGVDVGVDLDPVPETETGLVLQVVALSDAWVLVMADGREAYSGFVRRGESRTWRAGERVGLRTGNAGGTQITLNGNRLELLGGQGQVEEREWRLLPNGDIEQRSL